MDERGKIVEERRRKSSAIITQPPPAITLVLTPANGPGEFPEVNYHENFIVSETRDKSAKCDFTRG